MTGITFDENIMPFVSIMLIGCMVVVGAIAFRARRKKQIQTKSEETKHE